MGLVLDCADPQELAAFWTAALGYEQVGDSGGYVALAPSSDPAVHRVDGPVLLLQRVPEPKAGKNRMHVDLHTEGDLEEEVDRLVALGATRASGDAQAEHGHAWVVLADPQGNEFCVCRPDDC